MAGYASPGHQAGAPLRLRDDLVILEHRVIFPRPSGRGSIAATCGTQTALMCFCLPPAIRPGLHCGLRPTSGHSQTQSRLPPAIRPGLHCGCGGHPGGPCDCDRLPPAIRPGLHCGTPGELRTVADLLASPGHQAGAPLRPSGARNTSSSVIPPSPGHQAGAPLRHRVGKAFPVCSISSPGHQAGAPLRLELRHREVAHRLRLPPAIRPGLHCGFGAAGGTHLHEWDFPRPSGRGSIAAGCTTRGTSTL